MQCGMQVPAWLVRATSEEFEPGSAASLAARLLDRLLEQLAAPTLETI